MILFYSDQKNGSDGFWYDIQCVGMNTLGNKMKKISKLANLPREYTNHSIRATSVTILDECGFEARHIMCVSGHRSGSSICSYASKTKSVTKLAMSTVLSNALSKSPQIADKECGQSSLKIGNKSITVDSKCGMQFTFNNITCSRCHFPKPILAIAA